MFEEMLNFESSTRMDLIMDDSMRYLYLLTCLMEDYWLTNSGQEIPIVKMESSHIRNSLAMLKRGEGYHGEVADAYIKRFEEELLKRYPPLDPADEGYDF